MCRKLYSLRWNYYWIWRKLYCNSIMFPINVNIRNSIFQTKPSIGSFEKSFYEFFPLLPFLFHFPVSFKTILKWTIIWFISRILIRNNNTIKELRFNNFIWFDIIKCWISIQWHTIAPAYNLLEHNIYKKLVKVKSHRYNIYGLR